MGFFFLLFELALVLNAIRRSVGARWPVGIVLAILRIGIIIGAAASALNAGRTNGISLATALGAIVGPLLSFTALALAWHRKGGAAVVVAEPYERAFTSWMGVAVLDAMFVAVTIAAYAIGPAI